MFLLSLDCLKVGEKARVTHIMDDTIKRRFLEIGLLPGSIVSCVLESPFHEPKAYVIKGATIAIRREDTRKVLVEVIE